MGKGIVTQVQETQRVPNRIKPRRNTKVNVNRIILINNYLKCKWVSRRKEIIKIRAEISEK